MNTKVIWGPPGCGKTTRLMGVLEEVLKEHDPSRVAFCSFTRKGTYEGAERARQRFGYEEKELPFFRTLHSLAFRAGGFSSNDVIQRRDYKTFSDAMGMKFTGYYTEEFYNTDDRYLFIAMLKRDNPVAAAMMEQTVDLQKLREVDTNFTRFKIETGVCDYTDMIEKFVKDGKALPVDVAIIDEAQDLTTLQWQMCELAFKDCKQVWVAGDDDQAIYEWSGADVGKFLALDGPESEVLRKSWRLPKQVLDFSSRLTKLIGKRVEKEFEPIDDSGTVNTYNSVDELEISDGTWYFLSRNNCFLSRYTDILRKKAKVFTVKGKLSYDLHDVTAIKNWEARRKGVKLTDAQDANLRQRTKKDARSEQPWFEALDIEPGMQVYLRDLIRAKADLGDRKLAVNTIHGVKGGEADNVAVMLDFTRSVKSSMERNPDSELRCLYVACTRAKANLHVVHAQTKNGYDDFIRMEERR